MSTICAICKEGELTPYATNVWRWENVDYRINRCLACGSAYTDPLPSDTTVQEFYRKHFDYRWYQDHRAAKLEDCEIRLDEYRQYLGKRVLDYGGGLGYFSEVARRDGCESVTYDPYVNAHLPVNGDWDSVVCLHVLEHSNNPEQTLLNMRNFLRPGQGKLILAVPNFASRGYREQGMGWVWAQPPIMHIFHFTARGLAQMFSRLGFANLRISYHERWDANSIADINEVAKFRKLDAAWGVKPYNAWKIYRRAIAFRNMRARQLALRRGEANAQGQTEDFAELQFIATVS